jgi:hypothetical protein
MKSIYKILFISILVVSMGFARTSAKFEKADSFLQIKGVSTKKAFVPTEAKDESQDSVKWKRRHKRRKKAQNRKAQRGR